MKEIVAPNLGIEYFDFKLSLVINKFIDECMLNKDWEIVAIDVANDKLILKRYPDATPKI